MSTKDLVPGDTVNFVTYAPIGGRTSISGIVQGVTLPGGLPPNNTAAADHVNVYRELPEVVTSVTRDAFDSYSYLVVATSAGEILHIGLPWIVEATLQVNVQRTATITIQPLLEHTEEDLRKILTLNGITEGVHIAIQEG